MKNDFQKQQIQAEELAAAGNKVLLLVFNLLLAENIQQAIGQKYNLTVAAFHPFCEQVSESHVLTGHTVKDKWTAAVEEEGRR